MKNNFKRISSLILAFVMLLSLVACDNGSSVETISSTEIAQKDNNNFVVGFDAEYPPYGFLAADGSYTGFDLECAKEVCRRTGMNYVAQPIDWDSKDLELNSGNIDCIWNGFTMTGREKDYTFSIPYVDNSIVVCVNANSDIKTLSDLSGKNVAVQAGSSGLIALEEDENKDLVGSFAQLEQTENYNTCFMNLESGFIDAVVVDLSVAKYQISNNNKFSILDEEIKKEQYAIGFRKGDNELKEKVENAIIDMYKDGTYMNIAKRYIDYDLPSMLCIADYIK